MENNRLDVNGSSDKPFPQERNFTTDVAPTQPTGMGNYMPSETSPDVRLGQVKYARREGAESIYKDATRNTADDNAASRKAEGSTVYDVIGEDEESQGI